jgi:integrase/recombinase XerD
LIAPGSLDRAIVSYLDASETAALLAAPDQARWIGRRDHTLMALTIQMGCGSPS